MTRKEYDELIRRKPHLQPVGGLASSQPQRAAARPLDRGGPEQPCRADGVEWIVTFLQCRKGILDDDNAVASLKPLRDAVARTIGLDDGDKRIRFQYAQAQTSGRKGVSVVIEHL